VEQTDTPPPAEGAEETGRRRRWLWARPPVSGLLAITMAAMAFTMLVLQTTLGGFRVDGPAPPRPAPPTEWSPPGDPVRIMVCGDSRVQGSTGDYTWRYWLWEHLTEHAGVAVDFVGPRNDLFDPVADAPATTAMPLISTPTTRACGEPPRRKSRNASAGKSSTPTRTTCSSSSASTTSCAVPAQPKCSTGPAASLLPPGSPKATSASCSARSPPVWGTENDRAANTVIHSYNTALPTLAEQLTTANSPVVVARTAADYAPADDNWDAVHPNTRGELKIAAAFADALARPLNLGAPYPRPLPEVTVGPTAAPEDVRAERTAEGVHVYWEDVEGATHYEVFQRRVSPDPDEQTSLGVVAATAEETETYEVTGLFAGAVYEFAVRALKGDDPGPLSASVQLELDDDPPPAPEGLRIVAGVLTWEAAPGATHYAVWRRQLKCSGAAGDQCAPADSAEVSADTGWETVAVVHDATQVELGPGHEGHEFAVRAHRDYLAGGFSERIVYRASD